MMKSSRRQFLIQAVTLVGLPVLATETKEETVTVFCIDSMGSTVEQRSMNGIYDFLPNIAPFDKWHKSNIHFSDTLKETFKGYQYGIEKSS